MLLAFALLAACWRSPTTGPGELKWDRQTCERCQMVISERRHAAQTRTVGDRRVHSFDDLGCALLWLDEQGLLAGAPEEEIWVRDQAGAQWVDAHGAHFESGQLTPMQYGWATASEGAALSVVHERVREAERQRRSQGPGGAQAKDGRRG